MDASEFDLPAMSLEACYKCKGMLEEGRSFVCRSCEEAARSRLEADLELGRKSLALRRLDNSGIPQRFGGQIPPSWIPAPLRSWASAPSRDVLLTGSVGRGKTTVACALLRQVIIDGTVTTGRYLSARGLVMELQDSYGNRDLSTRAALNRIASPAVLLIDDLGRERVTEDSAAWIDEVIALRWHAERPTIVTTNLTIQQLADTYSDRVADRLGSGIVVHFDGESRRTRR